MVARRKAPRRRARKSFNISAIEAGTALSLAQSTGAVSAVDQAIKGNLNGALNTLQSSVMANKQVITATLAGAFVAKALTKGFASGTLAKLGPIRIKAMTPERDILQV
tara:strand:- start:105 stop:428 length:324 start_codon:yes stop_codon:yes gene_type:complete